MHRRRRGGGTDGGALGDARHDHGARMHGDRQADRHNADGTGTDDGTDARMQRRQNRRQLRQRAASYTRAISLSRPPEAPAGATILTATARWRDAHAI